MIVTLVNFKGSVGKTTTALNWGCALEEAGKSVALWDMDQSQDDLLHFGQQLNLRSGAPSPGTLAKHIQNTDADFHLVECPPRLDEGVYAALDVADLVLIPVLCETLALRGLGRLMQTIDDAGTSTPISSRLLITMYSAPFKDEREEIQSSDEFSSCKTVIPRSAALAKAYAHGQSIYDYAPTSNAAKAYRKLARESLTWL